MHLQVAKKTFRVEVYLYLKFSFFSAASLVVRLLSVSFKGFLPSVIVAVSLLGRKSLMLIQEVVLTRRFGLGGDVLLRS